MTPFALLSGSPQKLLVKLSCVCAPWGSAGSSTAASGTAGGREQEEKVLCHTDVPAFTSWFLFKWLENKCTFKNKSFLNQLLRSSANCAETAFLSWWCLSAWALGARSVQPEGVSCWNFNIGSALPQPVVWLAVFAKQRRADVLLLC